MSALLPFVHRGGRSGDSICLPVEPGLFEEFPKTVVWEGLTLLKKDEFHVTLLNITSLRNGAGISDETVMSFLDEFAKQHRFEPTAFLDDFRFVREGERASVVIRCRVSNLEELFREIRRKFNIDLPLQPAHVTLYTLQRNGGIHIPSEEVMESLPPVRIPELQKAAENISAH
ncbi:hypothetical protein A2763_03345 [Candidatus Kaiserbacteria bacterium RIFCSPHIGHO2_01_FULL_54_36]|uniref:Uncharacterized protein n=1 Tax=Candidatus Kaiserbacteria bacterium RIFCSPHIGHO2_01_FULL_54_36 TaxID=1798482 RepID=A0A1F6CKD2_9BACT|nr:MAG: hypothetical protein A2763_03345 [Candidatus Kaiserbacteria bacterium RIFCSPHIGHO2_01_FULL_54_36]OGG75433.1 MAG: hypothetical protein A3A41_02600 [Candidatus Kaiserbacteria bacterium RIFCSPLOWO2_01_FULL_54_22]